MESGGFGEPLPAEDELSVRFYALDRDFSYPMLGLSGAWLRGLPCLKPLPAEALAAAREAMIAANPHRAERRQGSQEQRILHWAPRRLCANAKVGFDRLTAGHTAMIDGKPRFAWYMQTDQGLMLAAFFKPSLFVGPKARLYRADAALRPVGKSLAEVSITKQDYAAAVPARFG